MLMTINFLAAVHTNLTIETAKQITHFLNYSTKHPDAIIEYIKSGIILLIYYNKSYI